MPFTLLKKLLMKDLFSYSCSLDCYKTHKNDETNCVKLSNSSEDNKTEHQQAPLLFTTMDTVRKEDLEKLSMDFSTVNYVICF